LYVKTYKMLYLINQHYCKPTAYPVSLKSNSTTVNLVHKKELALQIGKPSFWFPKRLVNVCEYVAGIEDLDNKIGTQNFFKVKPIINFEVYPQGLGMLIMHSIKMHYTGIPGSQIRNIAFERGAVIASESKSVIGRALVGGLLLGPLGAVIGGMSGVSNNSFKDHDKLIVLYEAGGKERAVLFDVKKGKESAVITFFKQHFRDKFSIA
jgi:hypothetical protein